MFLHQDTKDLLIDYTKLLDEKLSYDLRGTSFLAESYQDQLLICRCELKVLNDTPIDKLIAREIYNERRNSLKIVRNDSTDYEAIEAEYKQHLEVLNSWTPKHKEGIFLKEKLIEDIIEYLKKSKENLVAPFTEEEMKRARKNIEEKKIKVASAIEHWEKSLGSVKLAKTNRASMLANLQSDFELFDKYG